MTDNPEKRDAWLAERQTGIGSSDIATIIGLNPWQSELDLYLSKTAEIVSDDDQTEWQEWGHILEEPIAAKYCEITGKRVRRWPGLIATHPQYEIVKCSPDRDVVGEDRGLEIKHVGSFSKLEWGDEGTADVPDNYFCQVQWCMLGTGRKMWDLAALKNFSLKIYVIEQHQDFQNMLLERALAWWEKHIVNGEMPPIDPIRDQKLDRLFKQKDDLIFEIGDDVMADVLELRAVVDGMKELEEKEKILKSRLQQCIGEHKGIAGDWGKITWSKNHDTEKTDWQCVSREIAKRYLDASGGNVDEANIDKIISEIKPSFTETKPGPRVFRKSFTKGE